MEHLFRLLLLLDIFETILEIAADRRTRKGKRK